VNASDSKEVRRRAKFAERSFSQRIEVRGIFVW
jgi:hypothetical protein